MIIVFSVILLFFSPNSFAWIEKPSINPDYSLTELQKDFKPRLKFKRNGSTFQVDVTVVLKHVELSKLLEVSRSAQISLEQKSPNLINTKSYSIQDPLLRGGKLIWMHLGATGYESKQFLSVKYTNFPDGTYLNQAMLIKKAPHWSQISEIDAPAFKSYQTSHYFKDLKNGNVYYRFYSESEVQSYIPSFILDWAASVFMPHSTQESIDFLTDYARIR